MTTHLTRRTALTGSNGRVVTLRNWTHHWLTSDGAISTCTDITFVPWVGKCLSLTVVPASDHTVQWTHSAAVPWGLDRIFTLQGRAAH